MAQLQLSNYLEDSLTGYLNGTAFPSTLTNGVYFALFSSDPTENATGGVELTSTLTGSDNRLNLPSGWATRSINGAGQMNLTNPVVITSSVVASATATHYALFTQATGGNKLVYGELDSSVTFAIGNEAKITQLSITFV